MSFTTSKAKIRIFIAYSVHPQEWSGGNNFLAGLFDYFRSHGFLADTPAQASILLCDSYHHLLWTLTYKLIHSQKLFVYRFGPIFSLHRIPIWKLIDQVMILAANSCADLVIFQSQWSLQQAQQRGFLESVPYRVIHNGVDTTLFKPVHHNRSHKIRLIASSWSNNKNKGFIFFKYLDDHLDWTRFEMTFIGNSPFQFKNIKHLSPLPAAQLASLLQNHDIYIAGMKDDACSNALLEALACGLPIVFLDSGANQELVKKAGVYFHSTVDLLPAIEQAIARYNELRNMILPRTIEAAGTEYQQALEPLLTHSRRHVSLWQYGKAVWLFTLFKIRHG